MNIPTDAEIYQFFSRASTALGQSSEKIKYLFTESLFEIIQQGNDSVLEITTEHFTLSCAIDGKDRCQSVYIFINKSDELETVIRVIDYCRRAYRYSYLLKVWINLDYGIDLQISDNAVVFSFSKLKPMPDNIKRYILSEVNTTIPN